MVRCFDSGARITIVYSVNFTASQNARHAVSYHYHINSTVPTFATAVRVEYFSARSKQNYVEQTLQPHPHCAVEPAGENSAPYQLSVSAAYKCGGSKPATARYSAMPTATAAATAPSSEPTRALRGAGDESS